MMQIFYKTLLASILFLVSLAQSPQPYPNLDISNFEGTWYMIQNYDTDFNSETTSSCWSWDIALNERGVVLMETWILDDNLLNYTALFTLDSSNSVWNDESSGDILNVIFYDSLHGAYAMLGWSNNQNVFIVSRTTSLDQNYILLLTTLAKKEGYLMTPENTVTISYTDCTPTVGEIDSA